MYALREFFTVQRNGLKLNKSLVFLLSLILLYSFVTIKLGLIKTLVTY